MKKILLLALVMLGGVMSVIAGNVTIYFDPSTNTSWTKDGARFAVVIAENGTATDWVSFNYDDTKSCYYAEIDTDKGNQYQICRMNGSTTTNSWDNKWNNTPSSWASLPSRDVFFYLTDTNPGNGVSYLISLVPWNLYFYGNWENDVWSVGDVLTNDNGTYTGTLSGKGGKNFVVFWGKDINYDNGYIWNNDSWNNAIRPYESITIDFYNYTASTITKGMNNWYINTTNQGAVYFTYTSDTYYITCSKSATISNAGYMTYSNGEKCTVSGAAAYIVSANNTNSVTLTAMDAGTIWPANEGMILKKTGESSTVTISSVASGATASSIGTNYLVGTGNSTKEFESTDFTDNIYTFSWDGSTPSTVGFYQATYDSETPDNNKLAAHKAYLDLGRFNAREFLSFSFNDETGINEVSAANNSGVIYNLQGVRQNKLQKGLNIMNGKKVLVK